MTAHRVPRGVVLAAVAAALVLAACTASTQVAGPHPSTTAARGATMADSGIGCESGSSQLPYGEAEIMANPSVLYTRPADGRVNGYEFSLRVIGYAQASCVATDGGDYSAPPGGTIVVVDYDLSYLTSSDNLADVEFVVDGQPVSIPNGQYLGEPPVGVSVPSGASIELAASELGLTQELSLTTGDRIDPAPVLYRSPAGPDLTKAYDVTVPLKVVDPSDGFSATDDLTLNSVTLTYFSPTDPAIQPSSLDGAFLVVKASGRVAPSNKSILWQTALPPDDMRLVLADHKVIGTDPSSTYSTRHTQDLLNGLYFFDVPGDFTTGTIEVTPGVLTGEEGDSNEESNLTIGTARFRVSFPAPPKVVVTPTSTTPTTGAPSTTPTTTRAAGRGGAPRRHSELPLVVLGAVLLVAFLVAAAVARRRRMGPLAVDANLRRVRAQPALPDVPRLALMPAKPLEERHRSESAGTDHAQATKAIAMGPAPPATVAPSGASSDEPETAPLISFLGPEEISRCRHRPTRKKVLELAVILGAHPDRYYTAEELAEMLWPSDMTKWGKPDTVQNYATKLRKVVGSKHLPEADERGYRFAPSVTTDWARFTELVKAARSHPPGEACELLRSALGLVRGMPFGGADYSWLSDERLLNHIEVAIVAAARELAAKSLEAGDVETAWFAVDHGLLVSRDFGLCEDLLRTATATGDLAALDDAWARVERMVDKVPHLEALYEDLRRGLGAG